MKSEMEKEDRNLEEVLTEAMASSISILAYVHEGKVKMMCSGDMLMIGKMVSEIDSVIEQFNIKANSSLSFNSMGEA